MNKSKFRAWDKTKEEMIEVATVEFNKLSGEVSGVQHWIGHNTLERIHGKNFILMQYTGLKDVNEVEICQGDIVKVTDEYGDTNFSDGGIGSICGLDDLYMWYIDGQVHNSLFDINCSYYIEVIGNIHANPELLNEVE